MLETCGRVLRVRRRAVSTAIVYVHRSLQVVTVSDVDPVLLCATCMYLAGKVEDCAHRVRAIVDVFVRIQQSQPRALRRARGPLGASAHAPALATIVAVWKIPGLNRTLTDALLLACEARVLNWLTFDLIVFHPYRPLQECAAPRSPTPQGCAQSDVALVRGPRSMCKRFGASKSVLQAAW